MVALLKRNALTVFLALCVLSYQGFNLLNGDFVTPKKQWRKGTIWLSLNEKKLFSLPVVCQWGGSTAMDFASRTIKGFGYTLKYLAGDIPPGLAVGRREPFQYLTSRTEVLYQRPQTRATVEKTVARPLAQYADYLEKQGVRVVFVPIPTKLSIYREGLSRVLPASNVWDAGEARRSVRELDENPELVYSALTDALGDRAVDLFHLYKAHLAESKEEVFLYDDLHWTSYGMNLAAREVISKLRKWNLADYEPKLVPAGNAGRNYKHECLASLQLPVSFLDSRPEFGWQEPFYELTSAVKTSSPNRLIELGSSQSFRFHNTPRRFGAILAKSLGRTLVESAISGGGTDTGLRLLAEDGFVFQPGDVVVWEFSMQAANPGASGPIPLVPVRPDGAQRRLSSGEK